MAFIACRGQVNPEPEPLLLLEEGGSEELNLPAGPMADNSRCHVCHINYEDEALTFDHARADIGCEDCHGASDAHCADEDNITPPDTMFPVDKITSFCMGCHTKEKIDIAVHKSNSSLHRLSWRTWAQPSHAQVGQGHRRAYQGRPCAYAHR
jgi:hypothetical protein